MPETYDLWRGIRSDEDAEHALTELGPLAHRKEQLEAEVLDPGFRNELRARLVTSATERGLADTSSASALPGWTIWRRRWPPWAAAAVALAAVLIAAFVLHSRATETRTVAIATPSTPLLHPPWPAVADLLRAASPSFQGQRGGAPRPELSGFDVQVPTYGGHLVLSARRLPTEPPFLPAYRLQGPSFDGARTTALARHLGINAPGIQKVSSIDHEMWDIAAIGGPGKNRPLDSLAILRHTGELIHHNVPNTPSTHRVAPLNRVRAIALARRWIAGLGWPAAGMPVLTAVPDTQLLPPSVGIPFQVSFGWPGVRRAAETQATVIVMPNGDVIEARLWPPVQQSGYVATRDVRAAWMMVRTGTVPIAVQGMGAMRAPGTGVLRTLEVIEALDTAGQIPYLVPMYRFEGTVYLPGLGQHAWSALVPATSGRP